MGVLSPSKPPTSSGPDDTKPKEAVPKAKKSVPKSKKSDPKPKEPDPVSFISMYMYTSCQPYIHVYPVQDDEDDQYDVVVKSSHPEPETKEKLKEKVNHMYRSGVYIGYINR